MFIRVNPWLNSFIPVYLHDLKVQVGTEQFISKERNSKEYLCLFKYKRCKDAGLPEPKFEQKMEFFIVILWRSTITDEYLEKIGISERQRIAIKFIKQKGKIQRSEYIELCSCSAKTAYNDLQDLVNKDILIAHSKGKKTYYTLRGIRVK